MTEQDRSGGPGERLRGELVPIAAPASMREWAEQLVARAREDGCQVLRCEIWSF